MSLNNRVNTNTRNMKLRVICLLCAFVTLMGAWAQENSEATPAFPGAEGYGKYTSGGRGGKVYVVTSLEDYDKGETPIDGTLRRAVEKKGCRTIVFAVAGNIMLKRKLDITKDSITIAGQTAPSPGICIAGHQVRIKANNVILRYLRFRLGDINQEESDALSSNSSTEKGVYNDIIIDHCSVSWSTDECASFYGNERITFQWNIVSESLRQSIHAKGSHGYGGIWGGKGASYHHNLLAHHDSRNPRFDHPGVTDISGITDFRNNVIYNWGSNSAYGGQTRTINIVNNYYKPGPATTKSKRNRIFAPEASINDTHYGYGQYYIDGNYMVGEKAISKNNWAGGVQQIKKDIDPLVFSYDTIRMKEPFPYANLPYTDAATAYEQVLKYAGASLYRDEVDSRIIEETRKGKAKYGEKGIIDSQEQVGGFPALEQIGMPLFDSDIDGMPDEWEIANGLNPENKKDGAQYKLSQQYTNLEVYLNSLVPAEAMEIVPSKK